MTVRTIDKTIVNLSGYLFTQLDATALQPLIKAAGTELDIRGTVLLSNEGINCFVAGDETRLQEFSQYLFTEVKIPPFELKKSFSDYVPFRRFLVKVKKEIISTGRTDLQPHTEQAPYIAAAELKAWYDQDKDFIILDTRNDYEIKLGKFKNAQDMNVKSFRRFVAGIDKLPAEWKSKDVVTYCTGGIRCEKAALLLKREGFEHVRQLQGGILKYFEECGGQHYTGECFVFDKRIGVDPHLLETETTQCYACRAPLNSTDVQSPHYVLGDSCPHCIHIDGPKL